MTRTTKENDIVNEEDKDKDNNDKSDNLDNDVYGDPGSRIRDFKGRT